MSGQMSNFIKLLIRKKYEEKYVEFGISLISERWSNLHQVFTT